MIETDYLIVGAGAVGMNVADVLLEETNADILIVDQRAAPGGHWNDAYPFVRLHQPSVYYGVPSRPLGGGRIDTAGPNRGYHELPSGAEVLAYFDTVMNERLLPSGRVRYLPMHEADMERRRVRALIGGAETEVQVRRKLVDTSFLNSEVPARHTPSFDVAEGVRLIPPNALPDAASGAERFTVIGGGKTAMDVCVWLLAHGAAPESIRWIRPRDGWLINRAKVQPGDDFFLAKMDGYTAMIEAAADGETIDDVFLRMEAAGYMLRLDSGVFPTTYRSATISEAELDILRRIETVIRLGRVTAITPGEIRFAGGALPAQPDDLYIDCSAKAFLPGDVAPIFTPGRICPQVVMMGAVCLSAAMVAWVEANYESDAEKNDILAPIPAFDAHSEWLAMTYWHLRNQARWAGERDLGAWIKANRMSGHGGPPKGRDDPDLAVIIARLKDATPRASANLERLVDLSGHPNAKA